MKKRLFLFMMLAVVIAACKPDPEPEPEPVPEPTPYENLNPQQKTWELVFNYTASWCQYCGQWGVPTMNNCIEGGDCVGLAIKASGDPEAVSTGLWNSFRSDRGQSAGTPSFFVGNSTQNVQSQAPTYCQNLLGTYCYMGLDVSHEVKDGKMLVYVKTRNYESILNIHDFYIVAYLMEDGLHYTQKGSSDPDPVHNFVVREASSGDDYFGEQLFSNGDQNAEFTHTFSFDMKSKYTPENCYAAVVVYKKTTNEPVYQYVNCRWSRK